MDQMEYHSRGALSGVTYAGSGMDAVMNEREDRFLPFADSSLDADYKSLHVHRFLEIPGWL